MCAALLVAKTPVEERLVEMLNPTVEGMGYGVVRLRLMGSGGADTPLTLQIMAERPDGTMEVDDCAALSTAMSAVLDVEDPIDREYELEVSSPGIDRPLTRSQDFAEYAGHRAKIEMIMGVDGRRNFRGDLTGLEGTDVVLKLDDLGPVKLPIHDISDAKLVITDALIAESLKKKRIPDAAQADDVEYEEDAPEGEATKKSLRRTNLMASAVAANKLELLQIADAVAREKLIEREIVIEAMEEAIQKAARAKYGAGYDIRANIDPKTGDLAMSRAMEVVEEVENPDVEILLEDARTKNPEALVGDFISDPLPPMEFGRVAAQTAKQVIVQKVREAEREQQFDEYKDRIGEIINGSVKRVEYGNVVVDLGRGEAVVRRDQQIPREMFRQGDRIRAFIQDVRSEVRGPQIFLSRSAPQFMTALFTQEVPEIYDGLIEIKAVARDPGSRAKIGVISHDPSVDPVGACVGMRGSRVQAVVGELQGEKIDIIPWSDDAATFIVNALQPAEVAKVVLDEDAARIEVVVPDEQLSLAIGRRGQNVRLASQLTGWDIDIMTEAEESERRQKEFEAQTALFIGALDVDEMIANLLVSEGFTSLEEVAYVELEELSSIDGFDEETAAELQARAIDNLEAKNAAHLAKARELGMQEDLIEFEGLSAPMFEALAAEKIFSLNDFAELADWELAGGFVHINGERVKDDGILEPFDMTAEEARDLVMAARVQLGIVAAEDVYEEEVEEGEAEEGNEGDEPAAEEETV